MGNKPQLGQTARDQITGLTGVITGYVRYITGCEQYLIVPRCKPDATEASNAHWYDEDRVEVLTDVPKLVLKPNTPPVQEVVPEEPKKRIGPDKQAPIK